MKTQITPLIALTLLAMFNSQFTVAHAQGTAFTYQGRLHDNGGPASGAYSLRFQLYNAESGGGPVGPMVTNEPIVVANGLFTTALDFGATVFDGSPRWIEIGVRTNGGSAFSTLAPRQPVTPTPYAITAGQVVSGGIAAGTYGSAVNFSNTANQFAGNGGGLTSVNAATLGGVAASNFWQTGGNSGANASWYLGTADYQSFELRVNKARGLRILPTLNGWPNLIAGSSNNVIESGTTAASISGGAWNDIGGQSGSSTIHGGQHNRIGTNSAGSSISGGQWNLLGDGSVRSVIGGGYGNEIGGTTGTNAARIAQGITDGTSNILPFLEERTPGGAVIGGGTGNQLGRDCDNTVISGGRFNLILGDGSVRTVGSTIGGGVTNQIGSNAPCAVIDGGRQNSVDGGAGGSAIGGGGWNVIKANGVFSAISGGYSNVIEGVPFVNPEAVVSNITDGSSNTILFGETNVASGVIGGGYRNRIGYDSSAACIGGGAENLVSPSAPYSSIGGGRWNTNAGLASTIPGGARNYAGGDYSFASGRRARSIHDGSFVWADAQDADFVSTAKNQFNVRADGSVRFITAGGGMTLDGQPVLAGRNGGALTNLNAAALTTGLVPDARLGANVALRNTTNTFTGNQIVQGSLGINTAPLADLHVRGQGTTGTVFVTPAGLINGNSEMRLSESADGTAGMILRYAGAASSNPFQILGLLSGVETAPHFSVLRDTGNVGVGSATPLHRLHIGNYGTVPTINPALPKAVVENTNENGRATLIAVAGPGTTSSTNRVEVALEADENQRIALLGTMSAHPLQIRVGNVTRMLFNTNGNTGIGTTAPVSALQVVGTVTATAFNPTSDRNLKENFVPVSPRDVLEKVAALPISRWNFKGDAATPHVGPMAQDFHAAFGLGTDERHIATVDADGVALAALQGLNQKVEEQRAENAELRQAVNELKQLVQAMNRQLHGGAK